jgi:hypothetical protein
MKYLIHLEQGDDEYFFSVGPASWAWIHAPRPAFGESHQSLIEVVPAAVVAELGAPTEATNADAMNHAVRLSEAEADNLKCEVTSGSYENDRVLHLLYAFSHAQSEKRPAGQFADVYEGFIY